MTLLGKKLGNGNGSTDGTPLARKLALGPRGEDVDLPYLGPARIELVGERAAQEIEGEVHKEMRRIGIELQPLTAERFELEKAVRTLAAAVRDPADRTKPFGTVAEWGGLDNDVIAACWHVYGDVRERLDPLSTGLGAEDIAAIELALKKNDATLWRTFGVAKLSAWLASLGDRLSTSLAPSSSSSGSPPD